MAVRRLNLGGEGGARRLDLGQPAQQTQSAGPQQRDFPVGRAFSGGLVSDIFDVLSAPQRATTGLVERSLEQQGVLQRQPEVTGTTTLGAASRGVQRRRSFIDILQRIGKERKPQSTFGQLLTGSYDPSTSVAANFIRELPSVSAGLAGDILLDPLNIISRPVNATGKAVAATKQFGRARRGLSQLSNLPVIREFRRNPGLPENYVKARNALRINNALGAEKALELTKATRDLPLDQQRLVTDLITGGVRNKQIIDGKVRKTIVDLTSPEYTQELKNIANPVRRTIAHLGRDMAERGLISEKSYAENLGEYIGRSFISKEKPQGKAFQNLFAPEPPRINFKEFAKRNSMSDEVLKDLGEIRESGFAAPKTIEKMARAINTDQFFRDVTTQFGVSEDIAKASPGVYKQLTGKGFGTADGAWVPKEVANDLARDFTPNIQGFRKLMSRWKASKVVYNPATWSRNMMWNFIINDLSPAGLSIGNPTKVPRTARYYTEAVKDIKNNSKFFQQVKETTGIGVDTFVSQEIGKYLDDVIAAKEPISKMNLLRKLKKWDVNIGKGYGNLDTVSKLAHIRAMMDKGSKLEDAAKSANFYLVDYANVPNIVRRIRSPQSGKDFAMAMVGSPFLSFTLGVIPPLAKTAVTAPQKLAKIPKTLGAAERIGLQQEGEEERRIGERRQFPEWIQNGMFLRVPWKDKKNRTQLVDMQYILPFDVFESFRTDNPLSAVFSSRALNSPFMQFAGAMTQTKDAFGRDIIPAGADAGEAAVAIMDYLWKVIAPPLAPGPQAAAALFGQGVEGEGRFGGFSVDRLARAAQGRPESQTVPAALIDVLGGIRARPIEPGVDFPAIETRRKVKQLEERANKIRFNKRLTNEEKQEELNKIQSRIQKVITESQQEVQQR